MRIVDWETLKIKIQCLNEQCEAVRWDEGSSWGEGVITGRSKGVAADGVCKLDFPISSVLIV